MGHTHHFRDFTIDATGTELIGDIVAEIAAQGIAIRGDHGEAAPVIHTDLVWMTGAADEVVEVNGWEVRLDHGTLLLRVVDRPQALRRGGRRHAHRRDPRRVGRLGGHRL